MPRPGRGALRRWALGASVPEKRGRRSGRPSPCHLGSRARGGRARPDPPRTAAPPARRRAPPRPRRPLRAEPRGFLPFLPLLRPTAVRLRIGCFLMKMRPCGCCEPAVEPLKVVVDPLAEVVNASGRMCRCIVWIAMATTQQYSGAAFRGGSSSQSRSPGTAAVAAVRQLRWRIKRRRRHPWQRWPD